MELRKIKTAIMLQWMLIYGHKMLKRFSKVKLN